VVTVQNGLVYEPFLGDEDKVLCRSAVLPQQPKAFCFGTVGRLSEVKNHWVLIAAFRELSREMPEALLVIAGSGENEAELRRQVAAAGLNERVVFLGYRSDIPRILNCLDVFLLPSLREGFGLAMLEAMASRLPVIASRVGGIPEIFGEEDFGIMIDPNNPVELRDAMKTLANLPQTQREAMGDRARRRALEHFGAERMIAGYEQVYQEAYEDWRRRNRKVAQ
jgi:glycosyltransferase involved in cell wall biosynthesis